MRNYVAVVFNDTSKAYEGLHALWQLDDAAVPCTVTSAASSSCPGQFSS